MSVDCGSFGRLNCSTIAHTCGACPPSFTGESGSHNSICISLDSIHFINNLSKKVCKVREDCSEVQMCDFVSGISLLCTAMCRCIDGYVGIDCSLSPAELLQKQNLREKLLSY